MAQAVWISRCVRFRQYLPARLDDAVLGDQPHRIAQPRQVVFDQRIERGEQTPLTAKVHRPMDLNRGKSGAMPLDIYQQFENYMDGICPSSN